MKAKFFILLFIIAANGLFSQGANKNSSAIKKDKQLSEQEKQYQLNKSMLDYKDFVLQASYLQDRYGNRRFVNSSINFVAVDSITAIIQIGSDYRLGSNGVGGITAKGKITNWKLTENKKQKSFNLNISVITSIGIYDLYFSIGSSGNSSATLTGLSAGQLTFEGVLIPYSKSSVYEGNSL